MRPQQTLIFFLLVFTLVSCIELKKPPSVENCSSSNHCTNTPNDAEHHDASPLFDGMDLTSTESNSDTGTDEDAASFDTNVTAPDGHLNPDIDTKFDTTLAERPSLPVEPTTGAERGPEPPVEPSSQDARPPEDTRIPDTRIPDTNLPDTNLPDTRIPDTRIPDTNLPDTSSNCPVVYVKSGGQSLTHSGLGAYCILTCDILEKDYFGWGCYNNEGRTVKVNGKTMQCGNTDLPPRVNGHYLFEVSAGANNASSIAWWGQDTVSNCPYSQGDPIP